MNGKQRLRFCAFVGLLLASQPALAESDALVSEPGMAGEKAPRGVFVPHSSLGFAARTIQSGVRVEALGPTRIEISRESFPRGGEVRFVELPAHLGGGFLFFQILAHSGDARTVLYRSRSFAGELLVLGVLPFTVKSVQPGFDRIYFDAEGDTYAFDLDELRFVGTGAVPEAPVLSGLAFFGPKEGLYAAPLVGLRRTSDAGFSWTEVPQGRASGEGALNVFGRKVRLTPAGDLQFFPKTEGMKAPLESWGVLRDVVEAGTLVDGVVRAIVRGVLYELSYASGDVHEISLRRLGPGPAGACRGLEGLGRGSFLCRTSEQTRIVDGARLRPLVDLSGARELVAEEPGKWIFRGGCHGEGDYCVVRSGTGTDFVVESLSSGRSYEALGFRRNAVIALRRAGDGLALDELSPGKAPRQLFVASIGKERELREFVLGGTFVPTITETEGRFASFVRKGDEFVGVHLSEDGSVEFGPVQRGLSRASFFRGRVTIWGASGFVRESTDVGLTFHESLLPFRSGDPDPNTVVVAARSPRVGCGPAGCIFGERVVLGSVGGAELAPETSIPERVIPLPPSGGSRYAFRCERALGTPRAKRDGEKRESFWDVGLPPPKASESEVALRTTERLARFSVTGPEDVAWSRQGITSLRFRTPFRREVFRSAKTLGLFADRVRAEEALGLLEPSTSTATFAAEAAGAGGIVQINVRSETSLFLVTSEGPVERIVVPAGDPVRKIHGFVRHGSLGYLGYLSGSEFVLARLHRGRLEPVAVYPLFGAAARTVEVVSSSAGALGLRMDGDAGLFVYPVLADFSLGSPIVVRPSSERPPTCREGEDGYLVVRDLLPSPQFQSGDQLLSFVAVQARLRVSVGRVCLEALAARGRVSETAARVGRPRGSLPLVVSDFEEERSEELRCE